jgi:hypothetical protein
VPSSNGVSAKSLKSLSYLTAVVRAGYENSNNCDAWECGTQVNADLRDSLSYYIGEGLNQRSCKEKQWMLMMIVMGFIMFVKLVERAS